MISVILYGVEAWYPGKIDTRGHPTRTKGLVGKIKRAIISAYYTIILAYYTTLNNAIL